MLDFKIYVPTLDEERLLPYTLEALTKVFPKEYIEVLDLGSIDSTLDKVPKGIKVTQINLPEDNPGRFFTELKNEYSAKQEWVLWVDGDEIYPTTSLKLIRKWLDDAESGAHSKKAVRLYWRILKEEEGEVFCSNEYLSAGPKLFNSKFQKFKRPWPNEVTVQTSPGKLSNHKSEFTHMWFWHGVLLSRSFGLERTSRRKKRESKQDRYNRSMTWTKLKDFPWNSDYIDEAPQEDWVVIHTNIHAKDLQPIVKWRGYGRK